MNYFVEGLQGSGKSTLVRALSGKYPDYTAVLEGDYSPVELAWCAYVSKEEYRQILDRYCDICPESEKKELIIREMNYGFLYIFDVKESYVRR